MDFSNPVEMQRLVDLQNTVYEGLHRFTDEIFKYWYLENPQGQAIAFNAYDGDLMISHYVCVAKKMVIEGRVVNGILSMATVTHPNYRGRGLFKTLAKMTYDCARENGYEFVIGVANANSYPGFMKYFPFQSVGQLNFKVGYGRHISPASNKTFTGFWDEESIKWRCKKYKQDGNTIIGDYGRFGRTLMGCINEQLVDKIHLPKAGLSLKPTLFIGLGGEPKGIFVKMPKIIKHSPFNLIFLDLTDGKLPPITKDNIFFQLFDFDVV